MPGILDDVHHSETMLLEQHDIFGNRTEPGALRKDHMVCHDNLKGTTRDSITDGSNGATDWLGPDCKTHLSSTLYSDLPIPSMQSAIVTPTMGNELNLQFSTIHVTPPGPGEVVVRIAWTGLCRSDACFSIGPEAGYPLHDHIAGHEGIGNIVQSHDPILLGKTVAARYTTSTCGACRACLRDIPESCVEQKNFPKHYKGTFQQYITVPVTSLMILPDWVFDVNTSTGPWNPGAYTAALCSGSAALKALRISDIRPNDVIVIVGIAGSIGHLAGMMAKSVYHARVVGVDLEQKESSFLCDQYHDICDIFISAPNAKDESSWSRFLTSLSKACSDLHGTATSHQANAVLVAASSFSGFHRLTDYVCDGGAITCVGVPRDGHEMSIPLATLVERQLKIQGTLMGGQREVLQVMEYIRSRLIAPRVTEIGLRDVPESMKRMVNCQSIGKVVARVNGLPILPCS